MDLRGIGLSLLVVTAMGFALAGNALASPAQLVLERGHLMNVYDPLH